MSKTLKVVSVKKEIHQETQQPFLDVAVEISEIAEDGSVVGSELRKFGYTFGTTADVIKEDLQKVLKLSIAEDEAKVLNAETDELNKKADEVIEDITGFELGSGSF